MIHLDDADIALIEINLDELGETAAKGIIVALLERIRASERPSNLLALAKDEASDAWRALDRLREHLSECPIEADRKADEIEECLNRIEKL